MHDLTINTNGFECIMDYAEMFIFSPPPLALECRALFKKLSNKKWGSAGSLSSRNFN